MTLAELRDKRTTAVAAARAILDRAEAEDRSLTAEEQANYDKAWKDQESMKGRIDKMQAQIEAERDAASTKIPGIQKQPRKEEPTVMAGFRGYLLNGHIPATPSGQMYAALQADSDTAGGYLVPPEQFVNDLIKAVDDMVFIRGLATKFSVTNADSLGVPSLDNDPADADWTTELATGSEDSTMSVGKRSMTPHPVAKLIKVSNKLLRSAAMNPEALVMNRLAYKFAITEEKAFMTGTGSGQPLGVFTASSNGISTSRDVSTDNTTTAIGADNLRNVKYTLKGNYWPKAQWIFHRDAVKMISKLKDGEGQYLWRPGITDGDPDRLLGFPVNMSEYAPNTFTTGLYVGILGDFSNYWIADALSMTVQRLVELYAATNQVGFIGRLETDGMPVLEEPFVRVKLA